MKQRSRMRTGFCQLAIRCRIGILPEEYDAEQEIKIDLSLEEGFSLGKNKGDFIDYRDLANACTKVALGKHHGLLETLAQEILIELEKNFSFDSVQLRIEKSGALAFAQYAFVEVSYVSKQGEGNEQVDPCDRRLEEIRS